MSFSVVVVVLDAAKDIPMTLESILQQQFEDCEIIVVDGYSIDETSKTLDRYGKYISKIVHEEDSGIFDAMNRAVTHCTKDYVIFMNARDRFYSSTVLQKIWNRKIGDPDLIYGEHIYVDSGIEKYVRAQRFDFIWQSLRAGEVSARWHESIPCHQATFTRRDLLRRLPYDTRLELCADHDFMFRAFSLGASFQFVDEIVCHYFGGGLSAQRTKRLRLELVNTYRKFSTKPESIDRYFLGDSTNLFANETAVTGMYLTGFSISERPNDFEQQYSLRWCYEKNLSFIGPADRILEGIQIAGFNPFRQQHLKFFYKDALVAELTLEHGHFSSELMLKFPLSPSSEIRLELDHAAAREDADGKVVSFASKRISCRGRTFLEVPQLTVGNKLVTGNQEISAALPILLKGWSVLEECHVWSNATEAFICFRVRSKIASIELELSGNPHASLKDREFGIFINDRSVAKGVLEIERSTYTLLADENLVRENKINIIKICIGGLVKPPIDERELGVCLYKVSVS